MKCVAATESVLPDPSSLGVEIAIKNLKIYKSSLTDIVSARLWKSNYILRTTNFLILYGTRRNYHRNER